ncbi:F0F1 ATP synthase subunit gamma [Reyranella sp. CPCC 100927]|uniref:F0F1 ATP synthase subunit gamma n=1 Tax=Reyranella sp. CPCC 100927 TaxID=2599616 RepID=UPI0011B7F72E|nr:F0F1 ATP synthase subunit gamma [Reyranella sp. CPCC 100927]TWT15797.1 F0F1 ATP synthase subunit gamma [Reyranella sp. CPCC 100927]
MPSLKQYRLRIRSVQNTQKITKAMKMVAAAKLRRAQEAAVAGRPYATAMDRMMASLAGAMQGKSGAPRLLAGTGDDKVHLLIVATADRGLCGGFNSSIVREARRSVRALQAEGKTVKILCVGRKGRDQLRRDYGSLIIDTITDLGRPRVGFGDATQVANKVVALFEAGEFDVATLFYNRFRSAISQIITKQQIIPPALPEQTAPAEGAAPYEFEPDEETILQDLLPRNLTVQIYRALLENSASFFGAQMTAMDNATRNAGDMIRKLTLSMNRQRQAAITKELIEIISGAQAV